LAPVDLPVGAELDVDVRKWHASAAALLLAIKSLPPVEPEDTDALEQAIRAGKLPIRPAGAFDEANRP
jgi:hypothetical protein